MAPRKKPILSSQKEKQRLFAKQLTESAKMHGDWLAVVRFGLASLLEDQDFLLELILQEASRLTVEEPLSNNDQEVIRIFKEVGLRLLSIWEQE